MMSCWGRSSRNLSGREEYTSAFRYSVGLEYLSLLTCITTMPTCSPAREPGPASSTTDTTHCRYLLIQKVVRNSSAVIVTSRGWYNCERRKPNVMGRGRSLRLLMIASNLAIGEPLTRTTVQPITTPAISASPPGVTLDTIAFPSTALLVKLKPRGWFLSLPKDTSNSTSCCSWNILHVNSERFIGRYINVYHGWEHVAWDITTTTATTRTVQGRGGAFLRISI